MTSTSINKYLNKEKTDRFIELDILRGIAIILMIFLHILWDLDYFGFIPLNRQIYQIQAIVPIMFFLLVGMCLVVSKNKNKEKTIDEQKKFNKHVILRGIKIFGFGIAVTIATFIFFPNRPIIFGVLHFIGLSIIISIPFLKIRYHNFIFASFIIFSGFLIGQLTIENPTILHLVLGFHQQNIWQYTIDYFPIIPWFGVTLIGITLGNILYKDNKRNFHFPDLSNYKPLTTLSWMGKHSLIIYLLHQPVIAGVLLFL
jgi:uncharacterized membrane protein